MFSGIKSNPTLSHQQQNLEADASGDPLFAPLIDINLLIFDDCVQEKKIYSSSSSILGVS